MAESKAFKGSFQVINPDNSTSLIQTGEVHHIGGRIHHIGSAALPWGVKFSLDPSVEDPFQRGQRQRESVQAMADAFRNSYDELQAEPMDEAALRLEVDFTFERGSDVSKVSINETAIMSSQRWFIVALPLQVVTQAIKVASLYRDAMREYVPIIQKPIPNSQLVFSHMIPDATEENRPDIFALLDSLLSESDHVNCYVYSEPDHQLVAAWRGFQRSPDSKTLKDLSLTASASEIVEYAKTRAGLMDLTTCYWCEKNAMSCKLLLCVNCRAVSYCSKECQTNDWKAFHKKECKKIKSEGKTREELGMSLTRLATLQTEGAQKATMPFQLAPPEDATSVWRRDLRLLYLINAEVDLSLGTARLGKKSMGFPRGFFMRSRAVQDYMASRYKR